MHVDVAVALEGREDAEGGVGTSAEGVDEYVGLAVLILIKDIVHIVGIEVITSDEALQVKLIVCSFCVGCHNAYELWRKGTSYIKVAKRRSETPLCHLGDCRSRKIRRYKVPGLSWP